MLGYIVRRLLMVIPTLIGVAVAVFFLIRVMPGDPVVVKLRADGAGIVALGRQETGGPHFGERDDVFERGENGLR